MPKQASVKVYVRFGEIPPDGISHVHFSDATIRPEGGLSVWRAIKANGRYYPMLPEDANEAGIADFYDMLIEGRKRVYLVTGQEMRLEGADREPLLMMPVTILGEITHYIHPEVWKEMQKDKNEQQETDECQEKRIGEETPPSEDNYINIDPRQEQYERDLVEHDCGYWSVCADHDCPCSPTSPVKTGGFSEKIWQSLLDDKELVGG